MSTFWHYDKKTGPGQIICKNGLVLESPLLFSGDKIFDIGKPVEIPLWNKWYYDFLKPYQDGITKIEVFNFIIHKTEKHKKDHRVPNTSDMQKTAILPLGLAPR